MTAWYNENDPYAAQYLRNLIDKGLIAPGYVDERDIRDVRPEDLRGFTQCHFFAGVGVWSYAARRAGWPDDRPVWTGSCPCQPFSQTGEGDGFADERHLWPSWFHLIAIEKPAVVFGEQVSSKDALDWIDLVFADMEGAGYAFGALDTCAAGVGAPHIRQRFNFVAERLGDADDARPQGLVRPEYVELHGTARSIRPAPPTGAPSLVDGWEQVRFAGECDPEGDGWCALRDVDPAECDCIGPTEEDVEYREVDGVLYGRRSTAVDDGPGPVNGHWRNADWLFCRDGRWRPVEPGTSPLADGAPALVGRLRTYGNAVNAEATQIFIEAYLESLRSGHRSDALNFDLDIEGLL